MDRDTYFSEENLKEMRERFENLLLSTKREGMDELIQYIRKSDFYTAPASCKYHNAVRGGLLNHSLNVYDILKEKLGTDANWPTEEKKIDFPEESIIITALLHDICKTYFYKESSRNVKHYEPEIVAEEVAKGGYAKSDAGGKFVWVSERTYEVDDRIPYGHGEKSVMMIEKFIRLTGPERYMIRWHMGFSVPKEEWGTFSAAIQKYPMVLAIFEADMEASHFLDVRD